MTWVVGWLVWMGCWMVGYMLFSHLLIATMQPVVTAQAPITLQRKVTSGGQTNKNRRQYTPYLKQTRIPQTKIKMWDQRTYVWKCIEHIICETSRSRNRNRGDSIVPTRKRQDETNDVQIEIEKIEKREERGGKKKVNIKNAREKTARKGNTHTYTSGSQGARGACSAKTK